MIDIILSASVDNIMRDYIIHLGVSGFPKGNAEIQRTKITFRSLKRAGYKVLVISKKSIHRNKENCRRINQSDGVPYVQTSLFLNRPEGLFRRNVNKFTGIIGELMLLIKLKTRLKAALVYTPTFGELVYYRLLSLIFRFKVIIVYVELRSSLKHRREKVISRVNDYLFDKFCTKFCDGAIAISEFLKNHLSKLRPSLPILKVPAITEFGEFENIVVDKKNFKYLCYCGSISYIEIIKFSIDVFVKLRNEIGYEGQLVLIISGKSELNWASLNRKIEDSRFGKDIKIYSNISYHELISFYKGSDALLIPLRNTIQDLARFPHKVSEYTAAMRPVVSTNFGELSYYFQPFVSALLANEYSIESYFECLKAAITDRSLLDKIGFEGYKIGKRFFDSHSYDASLRSFIEEV